MEMISRQVCVGNMLQSILQSAIFGWLRENGGKEGADREIVGLESVEAHTVEGWRFGGRRRGPGVLWILYRLDPAEGPVGGAGLKESREH